MSVKQRLITVEEFWEMPDVPGKSVELVDGEVVEVAPAGVEHTRIMFRLAQRLDAFVSQHELGEVLPADLGVVLQRDPDTVRAPDVSFFASANISDEGRAKAFWEGPPTLAVEIVSPFDRAARVHAKARDYLEAGVRMVWVLSPETRIVTVYRPDPESRELGTDATLDGGEALPGFSVPVTDLFDTRRR